MGRHAASRTSDNGQSEAVPAAKDRLGPRSVHRRFAVSVPHGSITSQAKGGLGAVPQGCNSYFNLFSIPRGNDTVLEVSALTTWPILQIRYMPSPSAGRRQATLSLSPQPVLSAGGQRQSLVAVQARTHRSNIECSQTGGHLVHVS